MNHGRVVWPSALGEFKLFRYLFMMIDRSRLRPVILENPYDSWSDPVLREILPKIIELKLEGYKHEYPYGVLPVDTTDFIGVHHVICEDRGGILVPLLAYKSISLERCQTHRLPFPLLSLTQLPKVTCHGKAVAALIHCCESTGKPLSYYGSWTIHPEVRKDEVTSAFLREMMAGLHPLSYLESGGNEEILTLAVLRFKVDRMFKFWGYQRAKWQGEELPNFQLPSFFGEAVTMYHFSGNFPETALMAAKKFKHYWDQRLVIGSSREKSLKDNHKKRAA